MLPPVGKQPADHGEPAIRSVRRYRRAAKCQPRKLHFQGINADHKCGSFAEWSMEGQSSLSSLLNRIHPIIPNASFAAEFRRR